MAALRALALNFIICSNHIRPGNHQTQSLCLAYCTHTQPLGSVVDQVIVGRS